MSAPVPYFDVVRQMKNAFNYRLPLVTHARQHGIQAAARAFRTTVPTVRKWLRRFQAEALKGLEARSRAPRSCPHKIVGELAQRVVELRGVLTMARSGCATITTQYVVVFLPQHVRFALTLR